MTIFLWPATYTEFDLHFMVTLTLQLWSSKLKDPVSVHEDLSHLTLDVIGQSAFGYNFNTVLAGESKVSEAVNAVIGGMSFSYMACKALIPFFESLPIGETRRIKEAREIADTTVLQVSKMIHFHYDACN